MPHRSKKECRGAGCFVTVARDVRYCPKCAPLYAKQDSRVSSSRRGYDRKWRKIRLRILRRDKWCVACLKKGRRVPAKHVDHIIPKRAPFFGTDDDANLQGLCHSCHSAKTARGL